MKKRNFKQGCAALSAVLVCNMIPGNMIPMNWTGSIWTGGLLEVQAEEVEDPTETSGETESSSEAESFSETESSSEAGSFSEVESFSESGFSGTEALGLQEMGNEIQASFSDTFATYLSETPVYALIYLANPYEVKEAPSLDSATVVSLKSGTTVQIQDVYIDDATLEVWYLVKASVDGVDFYGYVEKAHLAYSNEVLLQWEADVLNGRLQELATEAGMDGNSSDFQISENVIGAASSVSAEIAAFPESYQKDLIALKEAHPNWVFVAWDTELDYNTVIAAELSSIARNLVPSSYDDDWKRANASGKTAYDSSWSYASEGAVRLCMDPRNFLTENMIFMFEQLTYNESYHTTDAIQMILNGTFMQGAVPENGISYAETFWFCGACSNVSPFHLASRVVQEQGTNGSSMVSGTVVGYEGLYNFFNIGATGSGLQPIYTGLTYAARVITDSSGNVTKHRWDNRATALLEGSQMIARQYIARGQDTLYLQKFDVDNSDGTMYAHQYMQNLIAPQSEAKKVYASYQAANAIDNAFVFRIPVYRNMPSKPCTLKTYDEEAIAAFVERFYTKALKRTFDEAGKNDWMNQLIEGTATAADIVLGFFHSDEFIQKQVSNEDFVTILYDVFLGRKPDPSGYASWVSELEAGKTRDYVMHGFLFSDEFVKLCDESGILVGDYSYSEYERSTSEKLTKAFVARFYQVILGREPEEAGWSDWTNQLVSGEANAVNIAYGFLHSDEFYGYQVSNADYVYRLYKVFLDREPDDSGREYWISKLENGESRDSILYGFIYSTEFAGICEKYGVVRGDMDSYE